MKKKTLIDLATYRKINGLTQKEVAKILGVSAPFISQAEIGKNPLPSAMIDYLLFEHDNSFQSSYVLVPCFNRIHSLAVALRSKYKDDYIRMVDDSDHTLPLLGFLDKKTILSIRHGKTPINNAIADVIIRTFPSVNKEWLITGEGNIFIDETLPKINDTVHENQNSLDEVEKTMPSVIVMLAEYIPISEKRLKEINRRIDNCERMLTTLIQLHQNENKK